MEQGEGVTGISGGHNGERRDEGEAKRGSRAGEGVGKRGREGLAFHHFPIPDLSPAENTEILAGLVDQLEALIASGKVRACVRTGVDVGFVVYLFRRTFSFTCRQVACVGVAEVGKEEREGGVGDPWVGGSADFGYVVGGAIGVILGI